MISDNWRMIEQEQRDIILHLLMQYYIPLLI